METTFSRRRLLKLAGITAGGLGVSSNLFGSDANTPVKAFPLSSAFKDGRYVLPPLPYGFDAMEPLYDRKTVEIHYSRHHAGYIKGLNSTLDELDACCRSRDFGLVKSLLNALSFHGSGHILHCLFWNSLCPGGSAIPDDLSRYLTVSFGSVESAVGEFTAACKTVEGSGWGILGYEPLSSRLLVLQCEKHQNLTFWGVVPLLVCDVWEHAYYLQYSSDRSAWVESFMKLANWRFAADRLSESMRRR